VNNFHCLPHRKYLICRTLSKEVAIVMKETIQVPNFVKVRSLSKGDFFFQPDMSRLANIRNYFVLLRGLVAVTRKRPSTYCRIAQHGRNLFFWKKKHRAPAVLKIQARIKMVYLIYIYIYICVCVCVCVNIKTWNFQWKAVIRQRYARHKSWHLSRERCNCEDETEEHERTTFPIWTCFWKTEGWVSGCKNGHLEYVGELLLDIDLSIPEDVTKYSSVCVCVCVFAAYLTSTSKIGWWHFKHC